MSWDMIKLDDCLELITYGFTNPMPDAEVGPWKVTAKDIVDGRIDFTTARHTTVGAFENDLTDKSRPIRDDVLLTKDGTLGRLAIVGDETICINQSVALLRLKKEVLLPRYLLYLLQSSEYQGKMLADAGGSTIKHIYITKVNQLMIPVPPIVVQQKLIDVLSAYDRMIDNCKEQIKLLEEATQRLYKEWFVDLRFPGHETTPIIDGIPEGWKEGIIQDVVVYHDKKRKPLSGMQRAEMQGQYRYYGAASILDYVNDYLFDGTYLLLGEDGTVVTEDGFPILQYVTGKFWVNNHAHVLTGQPDYPTEYLYMMFKATKVKDVVTGAAQPKISQARLSNKKMIIPCKELVRAYCDQVNPIFKQILNLEQQIILHKEARDRLLPKLMNGEIEV